VTANDDTPPRDLVWPDEAAADAPAAAPVPLPEAPPPDLLRAAFGRYATGVTLVTCLSARGQPSGLTVNSFSSLSLEPPLVLVSVANKAHMHGYLQKSGRYGVSVLTATQEAYSQHFAGMAVADLEPQFVEVEGVPLLAESLAHLIVNVTDAHLAGDHTLYIGEVEYVKWWDGEPLLYFQGRYARL